MKPEIKEADGKNHYHVLLVKKRHDAKNEKYIVSGTLQTFGKGQAFDKIKKNFGTQGYSAIIILHDPSLNAPETGSDLARHEKSAIERQIEKEEKEAMDKRIAERKKKAIADASVKKAEAIQEEAKKAEKTGPGPKKLMFNDVEVTEENIDDFAKDNEVNLSEAKTPEGKLAIVKKWIEDQSTK